MKHRKSFYMIIIWTCIIFGQSLLNGDLSSVESGTFTAFFNQLLMIVNIQIDMDLLHTIVRKTAHVGSYFILALCYIYFFIKNEINKTYQFYMILLFILITGLLDEGIQSLIEGRTSSLYDVGFDFLGGLIAFICFQIINLMYNRHVKKI
ncbi:MAG: VanZ family protein [Acholeplasmataceae bacterium]